MIKLLKDNKTTLISFVAIYLQYILEPIIGIINNGILGSIRVEFVAGLSVSSAIISLFSTAFWFLAIITTTIASKKIGENNHRDGAQIAVNLCWVGIACGTFFSILLEIFIEPITRFFDNSDSCVVESMQYSRFAFLVLINPLLFYVINSYFRSNNRLKLVFIITAFEIILDAIFCFTFTHIFHFEMSGAGFGKALAQVISSIVLVIVFIKAVKKNNASLFYKQCSVKIKFNEIVPLSIRSLTMGALYSALTARMSQYGNTALATIQIVDQYWYLGIMAFDALGTTCQIEIAKNIGRRNKEKVKKISKDMIKISLLGSFPFIAIMMSAAIFITPLLISSSEVYFCVIITAIEAVSITGIIAYLFVSDGFFMASGNYMFLGKISILGAIISSTLLTIPLIFISDVNLGIFIGFFTFDLSFFGTRFLGAYFKLRNDNWIGI